MNTLRRIIFIISLAIIAQMYTPVQAQETVIYTTNMRWYNEGLDLFQKEKYGAASNAFEKTRNEIDDKNSEVYVNATYYKALCALNLFHKDAEFQLKAFISDYPESPKVKAAYFQLGKYNYRKKKWEQVIYWFAKTDVFEFSNDELKEYNFRMGYAIFRLDQFDKASPYFHELIDIPSPYYTPANYYYAHISYIEQNYETALNGFNKLKSDKKFGVIIPYYITQIYYHQERYDSLTAYATPLLDNSKTKRKPEISKLVGDAWYSKKEYEKAIPFLKFYVKEGEEANRNDYFQLGFAMMQSKNYDEAIKYFSRISATEDALSQKAIYNMASCYLKSDNKNYARNAFLKASNMDFDPAIAEESLLSFAKLGYELDFDPYSKAIEAFIQYLEKYPNAIKKDEAFNYLVNIYLSTNNYRSALASLETTKDLDPRLREAYQQLQFNLAVEQFQNGNYNAAIGSFNKSLSQPENKNLAATSSYWIAESYYRQKQYNKAIAEYQKFIFEPRAFLLPEFKIANYALGYAFYQNKDYPNAAKWFRKYLNYDDISITRKHDALIRTGDSYFISKQYLLSQEYYQTAFNEGGNNADYALYQYATSQGLLKNKTGQITHLERLLVDYPKSSYANGALYELGKNYMVRNENEKALANFKIVIDGGENNPFRKKSLENSGLIHYNSNQPDKALDVYKQVVSEYPNYSDSRISLNQIQQIYTAIGEIDNYEIYIGTLDFMQISDLALDSLTYTSAENFYMDNNLDKAIPLFNKYIGRFDQPVFADKAHYYLAESQYKKSLLNEAFENYTYNLSSKNPTFYLPSLQRSAELSYKLEKFDSSLIYFLELSTTTANSDKLNEMHWWALKSASKIDSNQVVISEANYLLQDSITDTKRDADIRFMLANAYRQMENTDQALIKYREVNELTQEEKSAASLFYIAELLYQNQQVDSSETVIFELAQHTPTYPDWLAKGLILLSDIYVLQEDYFQARTTLESIVSNYSGEDEIFNTAKSKLDELTALENATFEPTTNQPEEEINFEDEETDAPFDQYDDLFDEEILENEELPTPQKPEDNE